MQPDHLGLAVSADKNARAALAIAQQLQAQVSELQQQLGRRDSMIAQLQKEVFDLNHAEVLRRAKAMERESREG